MNPFKFNELLKRLRAGEKVTCPLCGNGIMIAIGDYKTTHGFHCSHCKKRLNID